MKVENDSGNSVEFNAGRHQRLQRRLVKQKEQELEQIKDIYRNRVENVKLNHTQQLSDLNDRYRNNLEESVQLGQERLDNYRFELQNEQNRLTNQLEHYRGDLQKSKNLLTSNYHTQHKMHSDRLTEQANDASKQLTSQLGKLKQEERRAVDKATTSKNSLTNRLASDNIKFQTYIKQQENEIQAKMRKNKQMELKAQSDFRLKMQQIKMNAQKDIEKQEQINTKNFQMLQDTHVRRIKGQQNSFKQKIADLAHAHNELIKRIKGKYKKELSQLVSSNNLNRSNIAVRMNDDFYQMRHLTPTLQDKGDHYLLAVPVPAHERDNITLAANDRELILTFTRRFNQNLRDPAGNYEATKRSEVLTSRLTTPDIVTTKELTTSYKDDQLIFKVKKK